MARAKVLVTDYAWPDLELERAILEPAGVELLVAQRTDEGSLTELAADPQVEAILVNWAPVTARVIEAATRCRIISRTGVGLDNIDVAAATRRRIVVTNVPDYCVHEVAEHTLALILALGRKVAWYHRETKQGRYDLQAGPPLRRLAGQTLGVVGLGNIGRRVAAMAGALGLRVIAHTRTPSSGSDAILWRELDALLAESDYVSLHLPSTPATWHLIDARRLALMKPTAYLINTARGALVDEAALAAALASGRLAGAALDVQEAEPPPLVQPPFNDPRVIVTPHAAFASVESLAELRTRAARQVADRLAGRVPEHVVNPDVLTG